jgi:predicted DNA-binding transcriptional regulator AlpA
MSPPAATGHRLAGRAEIRKMLGVSHTRVVQIAAQPDFPAPIDTLSMGIVWCMADVVAWAERTGRTLDFDALNTDVQASGDSDPEGKREP